ncbi:MAG: CBS domain-containing protein, partial [Desulfuromonadaceae bacterium]|nr:CBS domain-containing protein [Desulfuromonadaceae bacterium]
MGYQLWTSPITGYRRKGTRFDSLKQLFIDNITAQCIYEPLLSCPINSESTLAKEALVARDFDIAGVKETEEGKVVGYVVTEDIGEEEFHKYVIQIGIDVVISDST